jgi:hypothetical protein
MCAQRHGRIIDGGVTRAKGLKSGLGSLDASTFQSLSESQTSLMFPATQTGSIQPPSRIFYPGTEESVGGSVRVKLWAGSVDG